VLVVVVAMVVDAAVVEVGLVVVGASVVEGAVLVEDAPAVVGDIVVVELRPTVLSTGPWSGRLVSAATERLGVVPWPSAVSTGVSNGLLLPAPIDKATPPVASSATSRNARTTRRVGLGFAGAMASSP
jgi:hypothetical protein